MRRTGWKIPTANCATPGGENQYRAKGKNVQTLFWIWMAAAVVFLIIEQFAPTLVFLSFAVSAFVAGIYAQFYPQEMYWQVGIFVIVTVVVLPLSRKFAKRITKPQPRESNVDAMLGKTALVTQAIEPDHPGKVRFEGEIWQAMAAEHIEEKTKVEVLRIEGTRVHVRKLS
jgi:membrane protein implicated in regulation of membrane protease activity